MDSLSQLPGLQSIWIQIVKKKLTVKSLDFSGNTKVKEPAGSASVRAIRSAERREEARINPHGRG